MLPEQLLFFALQYEKKCDKLLREKEVLATELWKLKNEMSRSHRVSWSPGQREHGSDFESAHTAEPGLDNYDPNNQHALRRKIGELDVCSLP